MKVLIFLLGLAAANALIQISPKPKDTYVPHTYQDVGKSFIYKYEAFLNSTLPENGVEFVGQKIKCDVELNILTTEIIHMNLSNILVQEVNGTYNKTLKEQNVLYPVQISAWNSKLTLNYTGALRNPITFQYVDGKILKVFANKLDPEWVVNMKKGIINMLTLKMKNDEIFSMKEEGISGTCETVYQVKESYNKDNVKIFNVTKVRDLTNCTDFPTTSLRTMDVEECKNCDKEVTQPLKAMATFKYNVTGERNQFFIESCTAHASYVMPLTVSTDMGSMAVFQNQSLVLKEVKYKEIRLDEDLKEHGSIKFVFPEIVMDNDNMLNISHKKVEHFTNLLNKQSHTHYDKDTPNHFINLVRSLRECNITQLRQVWKWTQNTMYKRDWIIKALPYSNKTDMTQLVKEMFFNGTIDVTKHGEDLLLGLGSVQKPSIKMIQHIQDVCELERFKEVAADIPREDVTKTLSCRRACYVSLGNMIHRFKKVEKFVPTSVVRSLTDCEESWKNPQMNPSILNKETYKMFIEFRMSDIKLQCIEAKGNAGLPDHIEELKEIIEQKTEPIPIDVRLAAITALRRMAKEVPTKVLSILLPVLKNPFEDTELRITAYLTMLECEPTPAMLTFITEECNKWTNKEVKSFVISHLRNLAKSTNPLEKVLAMSARYALLFVHPFNITTMQSQNRKVEWFTEGKKSGVKCEMNTVFAKQNIIPRKINTKCDLARNGVFMNFLELNVHTDSLNDVVDRIFGKNGSFKKRKNIFDMMAEKRTTESVDHTKMELHNIKGKVNSYVKQTYRHANTQFKMFDTEMWYKKLDDQFFENVMDVGKLNTKMMDMERELLKPQQFNFTKIMMLENLRQFPTIMGLPLSLNVTMGNLVRVMVNTTFMAEPSLQDVVHTDLVAKVNLNPEVISVMHKTFGCHTPINKLMAETNTTYNFTLPLSTRMIIDYETKKYSVQIDHLKKDRVDLVTMVHNITLIHEKTMSDVAPVYKRNVTVINGTQVGTPYNILTCFQPFDDSAKLCLNVTTFKNSQKGLFFNALFGPRFLEIYAKKGDYTPDMVVFQYQPKDLSLWENGIKAANIMLRFTNEDRQRTTFVERYFSADVELNDHTSTATRNDDLFNFTMTLKRSDIPEWRTKVKGFQRSTENIEVDCQWGMPKNHVVLVNQTQKSIQREYYLRFVSNHWLLPSQTQHNVTLLWADVPEWMETVGRTYKYYAPMVKDVLVKTLTSSEIIREPKRSLIDNSYQLWMKTSTSDKMDMIFIMPDQKITIGNLSIPTHTDILKKPLSSIINTIIKPDITIIPAPTTCKINNSLIETFDKVIVDYILPGSCPHILVRDCSSDERFTVLVQNVTLRKETTTVLTGLKAIVYVSKRKFELITKLDRDVTTKILEVKVDGEERLVNWKTTNLPSIEEEIEDTNTTLRRNETHISLISGQGISVVLSVEDLKVNVTQRHWNTTCGLCGNNDGEKQYELRTPWESKPTHVKNAIKYGVSWVVPADNCQDPECKLAKFVSFPLNRITDEEIMIGERKAACFSTEPIFYCPVDCTPVPMSEVFQNSEYTPKKMMVKTGFSCLRTTDPATEYRKMKDLPFTAKLVDLTKDVEVPQRCVCQNSCIEANRQW